MKYATLSAQKLFILAAVAAGLLLCAYLTFAWKREVYGGTPFFSSVRLFAEQQVIYALFAARHWGSQAAAASLALVRPQETHASSGPARAIPVLTYHRIAVRDDSANVSLAHFMDQMQTLYDNGWRTVGLADYEAFMRGERELPEKSFLITFDDGAQQSFYPTDPIFKLLGFSAVQYVIVAASEAEGSSYYLSDEQLRHVLDTGWWEIGSHSYDAHRPMPVDAAGGTGVFYSDKLWLPEEGRLETDQEFTARVRQDLALAKQRLEETYGVEIRTLAFPFGGEAGISGAHNFPAGELISVEEASKIYDIGWTQSQRKEYTFNYPGFGSFMHVRIHVDYDWDGERLLEAMENGMPKTLPFEDDMARDRGWLQSWGRVAAGGVLALEAGPEDTSASTMLDGSLLWRTYEVEAAADWHNGHAFLLGNALNARTYRACVFGEGEVRIQDVRDGEARTLARARAAVREGSGVLLGMRIDESRISCLHEGSVVLSANVPARTGGVGLQVWDETPGSAALTVTRFSASAR